MWVGLCWVFGSGFGGSGFGGSFNILGAQAIGLMHDQVRKLLKTLGATVVQMPRKPTRWAFMITV